MIKSSKDQDKNNHKFNMIASCVTKMIAGESLDNNVSSQISDSIKWNMVNNRMKIEYSDTRELYMLWKARTD